MGHREHKEKAPAHLRCAIVTVSDSRTVETDDSGKIIHGLLAGASHEIVHYAIVKDDEEAIRGEVNALAREGKSQVLILNGGTGISRRDRTPEALEPLLERELPGFGELFRHLSYAEIGSAAVLSRASAGLVGGMVVFLLPGSPAAASLAMEKLILPEMGHIVFEVSR
jgi:molybdenum cofactor biosynthesis protein B